MGNNKNVLKTTNKDNAILADVWESVPTYDELARALKDTHNLYVEAIKDKHSTHDITRIIGNDVIFRRLKGNM